MFTYNLNVIEVHTCVLQKHKDIHRKIIRHDQKKIQIKDGFCTTWQWMIPHLWVLGLDILDSGGYGVGVGN